MIKPKSITLLFKLFFILIFNGVLVTPLTEVFAFDNSTSTSINLSDGLMATYPFNGNANDESGNGYNGTVSGANLITDRFGNGNSAYYFDGNGTNDDHIKFSAPYGTNSSPISISLWLNADYDVSQNSQYPIPYIFYNKNPNVVGENLWTVFYAEWCGYGQDTSRNGRFASASWLQTTEKLVAVSNVRPSTNQWNNFIVTYDPSIGALKTYLNGTLTSSATSSFNGSLLPFNELILGREYDGGGNDYSSTNFKGIVDDINIYNRVLNSNEIKALSNTIQIQNPTLCSAVTIPSYFIPSPTTITSLVTVTVTKTVFHTVTVPTYITISPVNQTGRELENDINAFLNPNSNSISVTSSTNSVYNVEILTGKGISISVNYTLDNIDLSKLNKGDYFLHAKGFDGTTLKSFRILIE